MCDFRQIWLQKIFRKFLFRCMGWFSLKLWEVLWWQGHVRNTLFHFCQLWAVKTKVYPLDILCLRQKELNGCIVFAFFKSKIEREIPWLITSIAWNETKQNSVHNCAHYFNSGRSIFILSLAYPIYVRGDFSKQKSKRKEEENKETKEKQS